MVNSSQNIGIPSGWLSHFRDIEQRLVERLPIVWANCSKGLTQQPKEDEVTRRIVLYLRRDPVARGLGAIHSQYELLEEQLAGDVVPKGYIDIVIMPGIDPDCYVAVECKRLNVQGKKNRASLAGLYVKHGMYRYIKTQYSEDLPMGCMLGYVIDGDMKFALGKISKAILARSASLKLVDGPKYIWAPHGMVRFISNHQRKTGGSHIEIRHILIPI